MTFGRLLTKYRAEMGLSQGRLAERADLDHSFISRLESGTRMPRRDTCEVLIGLLKLTPVQADEMRLAAGFAPDQGHIVYEPLLKDIDLALQDPLMPREVVSSMLSTLASYRMLAEIVLRRERNGGQHGS